VIFNRPLQYNTGYRTRKNQRGIALITILLILSIMVTIAATMTGRMTSSLLRTEGLNYSEKIYWYGQAAVDYSRLVLNDNFADSDVVSLDQTWATANLAFPVDEGTITGNIIDFRSCFNVNAIALADEDDERALPITQFEALLTALDIEEYSAEIISESTRDWIDTNTTVDQSQGAEDRYYESLGVPHLAANALMADISELRSVQGVTDEIYEKIRPYLCALPASDQAININTVAVDKAAVLYALFPSELSISLDDMTALLEDRPTSGWSSVDDFLDEDIFGDKIIPEDVKEQLSVTSDYFQLYALAEFDERVTLVTMLFKIESKETTPVRFQYAGIDEMAGTETLGE
jgi:general secretion pathway protein K